MKALSEMNKSLLDALRHREQEVFRYLVILGPAIAGFLWLLYEYPLDKKIDDPRFCLASIGLMLLFLLGAVYSTALGYNYRCITFQLAMLERAMKIDKIILKGWPRNPIMMIRRSSLGHYILIPKCLKRKLRRFMRLPWCSPPGLIGVFRIAFCVGMLYLTIATCVVTASSCVARTAVSLGIVVSALGCFCPPLVFGVKLRKLCLAEANHKSKKLLGIGHAR